MNNNLYEVLEISQSASDEEIKYAYRKLSMKYHPDRNSGDNQSEEKFKEIKNAYEVLSDPSRRSFYDATGQTDQSQQHRNPMEDIFSQFMGGGFSSFTQHQTSRRSNVEGVRSPGDDVQFNLQLSLNTILNTYRVSIGVPTKYKCSKCNGSGSQDKDCQKQTCSTCNGQGVFVMQHGPINIRQTCPNCNGQGYTIKNPCSHCDGSGFEVRQEEFEIEVTAKRKQ